MEGLAGAPGRDEIHRLRAMSGGVEQVFLLPPGEHRVGSSGGNDLRLPLPGVSRDHALLAVTPEGLLVIDRGSKNGTFVDGRRVDRSRVGIGAELGFGPVRFQVESVAAEDATVAISLGDPQPLLPVPQTRTGEPTGTVGRESLFPARWLRIAGDVLTQAARASRGSLTAALAELAGALPLTGCCVVEWMADGTSWVRAAQGDLGRVPVFAEVQRLFPPARRGTAGAVPYRGSSAVGGQRGAVVRRAEGGFFGLFAWGEVCGGALEELLCALASSLADLTARGTQRRAIPSPYPAMTFPPGYLPASSRPMQALYRQIPPLLQGTLPILLLGETGVGKEQLARLLHASSSRRQGPFVAVNCAAIPSDLLESELFGIERGVATGVEKRTGKFQLADGGTLFLDEIAEMKPALQAKLLRALQEREVQPLGGRPIPIDVWILSATNADPRRSMAAGTLRPDLYYRLAGFTLEVPPLRQCREDVPALVEHFLRRFSEETGAGVRGLTVKALEILTGYGWPGNVRELEHEIRRLVCLCPPNGVIDSSLLSPGIAAGTAGSSVSATAPMFDLQTRVADLERDLIAAALERTGGNRSEAARLLGISRNGLADKIRRLRQTAPT